jgi:hypothetical protein
MVRYGDFAMVTKHANDVLHGFEPAVFRNSNLGSDRKADHRSDAEVLRLIAPFLMRASVREAPTSACVTKEPRAVVRLQRRAVSEGANPRLRPGP